jgi:hypothetical protein
MRMTINGVGILFVASKRRVAVNAEISRRLFV